MTERNVYCHTRDVCGRKFWHRKLKIFSPVTISARNSELVHQNNCSLRSNILRKRGGRGGFCTQILSSSRNARQRALAEFVCATEVPTEGISRQCVRAIEVPKTVNRWERFHSKVVRAARTHKANILNGITLFVEQKRYNHKLPAPSHQHVSYDGKDESGIAKYPPATSNWTATAVAVGPN